MVTGFRNHVLPHISARVFIEDRLQRYADAYEIIIGLRKTGTEFAPFLIHYINQLRALDHVGWRAPALKYLVDGDLEEKAATAFFRKLERLSFGLQFTIPDRDARGRRYRRVITAIDDKQLHDENSPLDLTDDEKKRLAERLQGRFATFRQRRAMSLRLNAVLPGGMSISPDADATLEHILPRNPKANSEWLKLWPKASERRELIDCLGNFTLLTNAENQEADRQEYEDKLKVFFKNKTPSYALSENLRDYKKWTPAAVRTRRDYFIALLCKEWDLPLPE